jgi:hypothetical protein
MGPCPDCLRPLDPFHDVYDECGNVFVVSFQLVIFPDATTMYAVSLEGLIAYRSDDKKLYFRDNVTWRPIRVRVCQSITGVTAWVTRALTPVLPGKRHFCFFIYFVFMFYQFVDIILLLVLSHVSCVLFI